MLDTDAPVARFEPECLTVGLGNGCNLDCSYCYAKTRPQHVAPPIEREALLKAICAAAEIVAKTSSRSKRRMVFGFQGAGEPFFDFERLVAVDSLIREVAHRYDVAVFSYITSNGTMATDRYQWAAQRFDRICISLDGPVRINDRARRFPNGSTAFRKALRTIEVLKDLGKAPACRSSVTSDNVADMSTSAAFIIGELGLREVQFEPIYYHRQLMPDPEKFVDGLLKAREIARSFGGEALYSGSRLREIHGTYCQTLRNVLFLTPNGTASACLFREYESNESPFTIGSYSVQNDAFSIDAQRVNTFNAIASGLPEQCSSCAINLHCTRGCPNFCPFDPDNRNVDIVESLGCRINRLLYAHENHTSDDKRTGKRVRTEAFEFPEPLVLARDTLSKSATFVDTTAEYTSAWRRFLETLNAELPQVHIADEGATVRLGDISTGCRYCKQGKWDCIFVTRRCNLSCSFCYSSKNIKTKTWTCALGKTVSDIIAAYRAVDVRGIAFSGGEALLEPDLTFSLIQTLRAGLADRYMWLYTNGVLLSTDHIAQLSDLGLNEIRFNTSATGNSDPLVFQKIERAARLIETVTVEIPAIPGGSRTLIDALRRFSNAGVKYLNLHELLRERNSNSADLPGEFDEVVLADGHVSGVSRGSREVIAEVVGAVADQHIPLGVNICSLVNKLLQLRARRKTLATLCKKPHERLDVDYIDSVLAFSSPDNYLWIHPDEVEQRRRNNSKERFFLLRKTAPLALDDSGRIIDLIELEI